ncbi:hypothetical protein DsansV1_C41g0237481 [Dioscorea sansibarensis]
MVMVMVVGRGEEGGLGREGGVEWWPVETSSSSMKAGVVKNSGHFDFLEQGKNAGDF